MAAPIINDLLLPTGVVLILPDAPDASTGVVVRRSQTGGGFFKGGNPIVESSHVLYIKDGQTTEVEIDGVEYLSMSEQAVVGIIPT